MDGIRFTHFSLIVGFGLIQNMTINIGALIFHELCSKIGSPTLAYPRFISLALRILLGDKYPKKGEKLQAFCINKHLYSDLGSKGANAEKPLTSNMVYVTSSLHHSSQTSSKRATKRKEPSSSQTPAFIPSKHSKSNKSQLLLMHNQQLHSKREKHISSSLLLKGCDD